MPRHPAFIPLSHDHHHSLVLALRLKKGSPTTHKDLWPTELREQLSRTLEFAEEEILPHFALEELAIFPVAAALPDAEALVAELLDQHRQMREILQKLRDPSAEAEIPSLLKSLGEILEAHIRKEERVLFPLLESTLSSDDLVRIERASQERLNTQR